MRFQDIPDHLLDDIFDMVDILNKKLKEDNFIKGYYNRCMKEFKYNVKHMDDTKYIYTLCPSWNYFNSIRVFMNESNWRNYGIPKYIKYTEYSHPNNIHKLLPRNIQLEILDLNKGKLKRIRKQRINSAIYKLETKYGTYQKVDNRRYIEIPVIKKLLRVDKFSYERKYKDLINIYYIL